MPTTRLAALRAEYYCLVKQDQRSLTPDERRSLSYFYADMRDSLGSGDRQPKRIYDWVARVWGLDRFVAREGRMPRENNRAVPGTISVAEQTLAGWVRYQRRPATRSQHCTYQVKRLEAIPGFIWDPIRARWQTRLLEYDMFLTTHHRPPTYRSQDPEERRLAAWAAKQRHHRGNGTLNDDLIVALERLPIWVWGSGRPIGNCR